MPNPEPKGKGKIYVCLNQECGAEYIAGNSLSKYCSPTCRVQVSNNLAKERANRRAADGLIKYPRKKGVIPKEDYLASVINKNHIFKCEQCGVDARRRKGGSTTRNRFCSLACRDSSPSFTDERNAALLSATRRSARIAKEVKSIKRIGVNSASSVRRRLRNAKVSARVFAAYEGISIAIKTIRKQKCCNLCEAEFVSSSNHLFCDKCRASKRRAKKSAEKAARRAMESSTSATSNDPESILEQGNWECYICGTSTPKEERGSYSDNAPEIDHVLPLSKGGCHSEYNMACSCRRCNGLKRDMMPIEFMLKNTGYGGRGYNDKYSH